MNWNQTASLLAIHTNVDLLCNTLNNVLKHAILKTFFQAVYGYFLSDIYQLEYHPIFMNVTEQTHHSKLEIPYISYRQYKDLNPTQQCFKEALLNAVRKTYSQLIKQSVGNSCSHLCCGY